MQKPDSIGNGEFDDRIVREGLTHGNNDGTWEGKGLHKATHDSEIKGHTGKKVADKLATTGKARSQTLRAFATSVKKRLFQRHNRLRTCDFKLFF